MGSTDESVFQDFQGPVTRRGLLTRAGVAAATVSPLLAACGSSSPSQSKASGGSSVTALGRQLNPYVGPGGSKAGQGRSWTMGASLPLSGAGAFFGREMVKGVNLAVDHIKQAGGPDISVIYKDDKTGDPNAGVQTVRELGIQRIPALMNGYLADFGAEIPGIAAYKMLSIDPGGGTGQSLQGKPYFWGSRASWPNAPFDGVYQYVAQTKPQYKRVSLLIWDNGAAFVNPAQASLEAVLRKHGMQLVSVEKSPAGATDFSTTVARLSAANPDVIQVAMSGADVAYFLKGKAAGGLKAQAVGADWNPDTQKQAGSAAAGFWFAFDYFQANKPPNPWSKIFVDEFRKKYSEDPIWLSANYYESTFIYWELIRRVLTKGGDMNSGTDLQSALLAKPTFPSVYGGNSSQPGILAFDPQTHTIAKREMSMLEVESNGDQKLLATFGINGVNYQKVASPSAA